jgi:D-3-phosphoglycerate dehydrogenase
MKVARMAKGLGMGVVVYDPYASKEVAKQAGVELRGELAALLPDVVSFFLLYPYFCSFFGAWWSMFHEAWS